MIVFQQLGFHKTLDEKFTKYRDENFETVKSFKYLGVRVSNATSGLRAAQEAVRKEKIVSETAINMLAGANCKALDTSMKLYHGLIVSTLLYAFSAWSQRYTEVFETAQTNYYFFKTSKKYRLLDGIKKSWELWQIITILLSATKQATS